MNRFLISVKYSAIHKKVDGIGDEPVWLIDVLKSKIVGGFFVQIGPVVDDRYLADVGNVTIDSVLSMLPDDIESIIVAAWSDEGTTPVGVTFGAPSWLDGEESREVICEPTYPFNRDEYLKFMAEDEDGNKPTECKSTHTYGGWPLWKEY